MRQTYSACWILVVVVALGCGAKTVEEQPAGPVAAGGGTPEAGSAGCVVRPETYDAATQFVSVPGYDLGASPPCQPTCGAPRVGVGYVTQAFPAGACTNEPACGITTQRACPCAGFGAVDSYLCACVSGRWSCNLVRDGQLMCYPECPDASSPDIDASVGSCYQGWPVRLPVCDGGADLELAPVAGSTCRYKLVNPPLYDFRTPNWVTEQLIVGIELPSGQGVEVIAHTGSAESCPGGPAWFARYTTDSFEIELCPCSCARLKETGGTLRVLYGCGGGGVWMN